MKKKIFKIIIVVIIILLIFSFVIIKFNSKKEKSSKKDKVIITEKGIIKDEKLLELDFVETSLVYENGTYTLSMAVTNNTNEICNLMDMDVVIKDKEGKVIATLPIYLNKKLTPADKVLVTIATKTDISKAYTKEIVERK